MQTLWQHTFNNELRIDSSEYPVMMTEAALNPKNNRERSLTTLFEMFNVPTLNMAVCPVVSLFASGRTTGVVLECGDGVTHTAPVYEGYVLPHAILRLDIAGRDLTDRLCQLLNEKGLEFTTVAEREVVRKIKEDMCFIAKDFDEAIRKSSANEQYCEQPYELPDGQTIDIGNERFKCPEALFQPKMLELDQQGGIQNLVNDSIRKCDMDIRRLFFKNIILAGGSTMFKGFHTRLTGELGRLAPKSVFVRVCATSDRRYSCWVGASVLAEVEEFRKEWITREEYDEHGAAIIHKRCP